MDKDKIADDINFYNIRKVLGFNDYLIMLYLIFGKYYKLY